MTLPPLKPGDKIAISCGHSRQMYRIGKVKSVSPGGRITLDSGNKYNADGWRIGGDKWNVEQLVPITPEVAQWIRHERVLAKVSHVDWRELGTDALERVWLVVEHEKRTKQEVAEDKREDGK